MLAMNKYLLISLMLVSAHAFAELNKWVDADGRVHYSDVPPPPDASTKTLRTTPAIMGSKTGETPTSGEASTASSTPKTTAEREVELKKAQQAKKEAADKAAKKQADAEANKTHCANLQKDLRALQDGIRMVELDADGNQSYIDDEQRQQRIAKTQRDIGASCK